MSKLFQIEGYVGKDEKIDQMIREDNVFRIVDVMLNKEKRDKEYWGDDYPPKKLKFTIVVEELDD